MDLYIDKEGETPLFSQVFTQLKQRILKGKIKGGSKLPSTRDLAKDLGISRNVIIEAYDQLYAEGFTEGRRGDGTYVTENITFVPEPSPELKGSLESKGFKPLRNDIIDFRSGIPDLKNLPVNKWMQIAREIYLESDPSVFAYNQPEGMAELRREIACYVSAYRGVSCHADQILITGGTTQAIGIVSRLLLKGSNKNVIVEDPVTYDIPQIIERSAGIIHPVPVDKEGIICEDLEKHPPARFIYLTPSHHFPLGVTLTIKRRIELIKYAAANNTYLIEDDYDSEFRYDVKPTPALQGLDPKRVVYLGTFSKTLFPALRIGYIIFPPELIAAGREQKWFSDLHNPVLDQLILARFIAGGHFARTIGIMKKRYRAKREYLIKCLSKRFADKAQVLGSPAGLHMAVRFPGTDFTPELIEELEKRGVIIYPAEEHALIKGRYRDTVILGFAYLDRESLEKGICILAKTLQDSINSSI